MRIEFGCFHSRRAENSNASRSCVSTSRSKKVETLKIIASDHYLLVVSLIQPVQPIQPSIADRFAGHQAGALNPGLETTRYSQRSAGAWVLGHFQELSQVNYHPRSR